MNINKIFKLIFSNFFVGVAAFLILFKNVFFNIQEINIYTYIKLMINFYICIYFIYNYNRGFCWFFKAKNK